MWSAPEDDGGEPILDYSVEKYDEVTLNFTVVASGLTPLAYTETGLSENTTYHYRVRAKNSFGFGDY